MLNMIRYIIITFVMILSCSCQTDVQKEELELKNQLIGITGDHYSRQLGGYQIGNKNIKNDLLLRTAAISGLTEADSIMLADKYKVQRIYDFRGKNEAMTSPDVIPGNAGYLSLSISFDVSENVSEKKQSQEEMIMMLLQNADNPLVQDMCDHMYDKIFFEESSMEVYRRFFEDLASIDPDNGAVLWHCTSGKDRTGVTAALLLLALGASWETVLEDYLQTNIQTQQQREALCQGMADRNVAPELIEEIRTIESVDPVYLETCRHLIEEKYGSMDQFFVQALGLTEEKRIRLQRKYTCQATL